MNVIDKNCPIRLKKFSYFILCMMLLNSCSTRKDIRLDGEVLSKESFSCPERINVKWALAVPDTGLSKLIDLALKMTKKCTGKCYYEIKGFYIYHSYVYKSDNETIYLTQQMFDFISNENTEKSKEILKKIFSEVSIRSAYLLFDLPEFKEQYKWIMVKNGKLFFFENAIYENNLIFPANDSIEVFLRRKDARDNSMVEVLGFCYGNDCKNFSRCSCFVPRFMRYERRFKVKTEIYNDQWSVLYWCTRPSARVKKGIYAKIEDKILFGGNFNFYVNKVDTFKNK